MSGDVLTVLVGLVGVLVSVGASAGTYRLGKRTSLVENAELLAEISALRGILSSVVQRISSPDSDTGIQGHLRPESWLATEPPSADNTANVVVRAVLGSLVNEKGEVAFHRLLREVSLAMGHPSFAEVAEVLTQLRGEGFADWYPDEPDLAGVETIHVGARRDRATSASAPFELTQ
jgi:hypothetical protein